MPVCGVHGEGVQLGTFRVPDLEHIRHVRDQTSDVAPVYPKLL